MNGRSKLLVQLACEKTSVEKTAGIVETESTAQLDHFDDDFELQNGFRILAWIESQQNVVQDHSKIPEPMEDVLCEPVTNSPTQQGEIIGNNLEDEGSSKHEDVDTMDPNDPSYIPKSNSVLGPAQQSEIICNNYLEGEGSNHEDLDPDDPPYIPESDSEVEDGDTFSTGEVASEEEGIFPLEESVVNIDSQRKRDPTPSPVKIKKARKGHSDPNTWVIKRNQKLREKGLPYNGLVQTINGKRQYVKPRQARKLLPRCDCKLSKLEKGNIRCREMSDENRKMCFKEYWSMDWSAKKATVRSLVTRSSPKDTRNKKNAVSRRNNSLQFHLIAQNNEEQKKIRVCKTMFLNTFGLKEWTVMNWINVGFEEKAQERANSDQRKVKSERRRSIIKEFLGMLAKMESHYCRKDTERLYLEPIWDSKRHVYREYQNYCKEKNEKPLDFTVFSDVFAELKISVFSPRKDQCDVCVSHANGSSDLSDEDYQLHRQKKDEAQNEKRADIGNPEKKFVFSMDAQAVMVCPVMRASAVYFKTKLTVHNFTIYNPRTHDGLCNLWDESEADLQSSVFASMIIAYLEELPLEEGDEIILWSDGCTYQNRNSILSNALVNFAMNQHVTVIQKFLEKGHTEMECDAMHACIQRKFAKKNIYLPSTYQTYCETARQNPRPYVTKYWHFEKFLDFTKLSWYPSIRPGKKSGDPCVTDIRALRYEPDGVLSYKLQHSSETWEILPSRKKSPKKVAVPSLPKLFKTRQKIKDTKFRDLQSLKSILPRDTHAFYDNLLH